MNKRFNVNEFRGLDLNVLLTFVALMRERSVTKAAAKLFLGPPAVSMALRRLRDLFGDPLFVRTRQGMEPTPRALELFPRIEASLGEVHAAVFEPPVFEASRLERTVRFAAPDDLELALVPSLLAYLAEQAPKVRLVVRPSDFRSVLGALDSDDAELALTAMPDRMESWHRCRVLHQESFLCLYDRQQLGRKGPLTLKQYIGTPHLLLSPRGEASGPIDDELAKQGLKREVLVSVAHFPLMPFLLRKTPSLVNMPARAARFYAQEFGLEVCELPIPSSSFEVGLLWHAKNDAEPALRWLVDAVARLVNDLRPTVRRTARAQRT
jgi:LysR family transcriptional regulator, mexEF-oprN operon transcriptional activator